MNKKSLIIIIMCMVGVLFTALSVSAASDAADNMTVGSEDQTVIEAQSIQEDVLRDTPGNFEDLNTTIYDTSVPEGGTVSLIKDYTYSDSDNFTNGITINRQITIDGNGYTISASNKASIFTISNDSHVILQNIVFADGNATDGGAIYVEHGSTIEIINCTFQNNFASNNGGAIFIAADSLTSTSTIYNSIFTNNLAGNNGGAIFDTFTTINVTLSNFTYNTAGNCSGSMYIGGATHIRKCIFDHETAKSGGAIELLDDIDNHSTIENSTFKNCYASGDGGAGYIRTNNVIVENVIFTDNTAGDDGGALFWEGDNGIIYNITCTNNKGISIDKGNDTSSTRGGAICLTGDNVTVSKSTFTSCSAYMDEGKDSSKVDGGALFVTGNGVLIDDVTFTDCNAVNSGGALYVIGNNTHIYNCGFSDSKAKDGAALYVDGSGCMLYNSTFTANVADDDGGAIFWQGDNGVMHNITCVNNKGISFNTSSSRGGTICLTGDNVTVSKSSFKTSSVSIAAGRDSTKIDGGALFLTGNDIVIIDTEFDDCKATNGGGAVYVIGNNTRLLNCSYTNTQALVGGAVFVAGDDSIVDGSLFRYNDAKGATQTEGGTGGAIYVDGKRSVISNSDFAYDTSVRYGGAIAVWGPDAVITNNTFDNSTATEFYGGAIFINGFNATISYSNFTRSKTTNTFTRGGAIDVGGDNANILGCNFYDCYSYFGGDIYVNGANAIINGSNFEHCGKYNNKYPYEGGAIFVNGTHTTILKSNFTDLDSVENGGAIYIAGTNTNISESSFLECDANGVDKTHGGWGGAIYISGADTNIEKSNFTSCDALNSNSCGGAIYINGANTLIKESAFDNCEAEKGRGGDIYVFGNGARIEDSTFKESQALYGGAIYLEAWGAVIKKSNVTECFASNNGGAIYVAGGGTNIIESSFEGCTIGATSQNDGGGAIYINGPDTHISASEFNNNVVAGSARGGAIYIMGERTIIEGSEFNASSANEGGIICIQGEEALIDSSTFANSSSNVNGGAIFIHGDNATIRGSHFENVKSYRNSGESRGGAIYVNGENTNILTSSFDACSAKTDGGAIYIADLGTTVAYSNFTHSNANTGGAIFINGINTTISYCNIHNNSAKSAGAIKVSGSDSYISNSNISYNTATSGSGGALDIGGERASVLYSYFSFNKATGTGGAINWQGGHGNDSIIGTTFLNNSCTGQPGGGAIFWTQGTTMASGGLIKDCKFINNSAYGKHGGALNWYRTIDSTIDNCLFINNYASSDGGALYTGDQRGDSRNLTFINSQFYNNTAGKHGGAIANQMAKSYIFNITFDGNKAGYSGGSILMKEGPARDSVIDHCYIYNSFCNQKGDNYGDGGGAIHIQDNNITISNCAIINSTANKTYGGAIAFEKDKDSDCLYGSLINVTIQNVKTNSGNGGAIYWSGSYGYMHNVTIFNASSNSDYNTAANGGAIYVSGSNCNFDLVNIASSSSNNKNTASSNQVNGGAIYVSGAENVLTNVTIDDSQASTVRMNGKGGAIYWSGNLGTLINATISNTLANGEGGAIYWSGSSLVVENISIEYSQTNVTDSSSANGGAIYSTSIDNLKNVYIVDALASATDGDVKGGAIYYSGMYMDNVTVIGSRAATDSGTSYGGAVYWLSGGSGYLTNSSFERNTADYGGAIYALRTLNIDNTSFTGNVALDGGALYGAAGCTLTNTTFILNSAKRGGAIFTNKVYLRIDQSSSLKNNTAEEKGGAIYYIHRSGVSSYIRNTDLVNNTAFQGSAIYTTNFFELTNVTLLDNQANSKEFIDKHVGVDETGRNYTSAVFVGFDNVLNAMWVEEATINIACTNVTYWGVNGINVSNSKPRKSDREVWQNVTVETFNGDGEKIGETPLVTDGEGRVIYYFTPVEGKTYYFAYTHETDRYYTYLRDTLSNRSLVKIYAYTPLYYNQNQTLLISLTDGAWGDLNGTVTIRFNDTENTTYIINVTNGTHTIENISGIPIGTYNVTATFDGDTDHTGSTDWVVFEVLPYDDLHITKDVNITSDYVNVTDYIKYTINVTNHGPSAGRGVNVTEILSPYLKLIKSNATRGSYNYTGGYWYIGDLDVNETVTLTIIAQIIHAGPITNTVWVNGLGNDTNITNNIDSAHNFTAYDIVDLRIVKKINVTETVIHVTDIIKYTITVYNDGPCNATGVFVGEVLDYHLAVISINASVGSYANGTWNIGNLDNATNATLTIVARVIYSGNITNNVRVDCFENDTNMSNNYDNVTNVAIANVDLQIIKEVNVTGFVNVTDKIKFTIHIYNAGPANATGVFVSEILNEHIRMLSHNETIGGFDGSTWIINNLDTGVVHNLTIIAEVISPGNITNEVNITSIDNDTNLTNNHDNITNITALPIVDLVIRKEVNVSAVVNVDDVIKFTITVHNNGPCDATNVNVTEKLSKLLKVIDNGINATKGTYNPDTGIWMIGNMSAYSEEVLTIICKVMTNGTIANVVAVKSTENDTNTSNNIYNITNITALPIVDLSINKTVNISAYANVSDIIKFTITVHNKGPSNATMVWVSEKLSPYLKLINATGPGNYNKTSGVWYIGELKTNETVNLTLVCEITGNGTVINEVNVTSYENDTDPSNNWDGLVFAALPIVDVSIIKTIDINSTVINFGDKIKFTITVHNKGPSNATGVYVDETLDLTHLKLISANATVGNYSGNTWSIGKLNNGSTATLTIVCEAIELGNFTNFVKVFSFENDTNTSNDNDTIDNITIIPVVDLEITKTVTFGYGVVNVGELVQFVINVINKGPCNATNVTVVEKLSPLLEITYIKEYGGKYNAASGIWYIGDLKTNVHGDYAQLIIQARVISNGTISNFVAVNSTENDTNTSNNNDTIDNITALPIVNLIITKEVNETVVNVTDKVKYTITVFNDGPCNATQVNVSEVLDTDCLRLISAVTNAGYFNATGGYWYIGNITNKTGVTLTLECEVINDGLVYNYVEVTCYENETYPYDNWDHVTFIALPIVDISITKEGNFNGSVNVTDIITFTITVHNSGPSNATSVMVYEILNSTYLKFISYNATKGVYNGVSWFIGDLNNGSTEVLNVTAEVIASGSFSNFVNVTSYETDTDMSNNYANITNITSHDVVDLEITKIAQIWAATSYVLVGGTVQFTITVVNKGPCNATNVTVVEKLSPLVELTNDPGQNYNATTGIWDIGNLAKDEFAQLILVVKVLSNGTISNFVSVNSTENDTNMSNNNYTIDNITALPSVNLIITKQVNETVVNVTGKVKYTITVFNDGPSNATQVNVSEVLDTDCLRLISAVTNAGYFNATGGYWYIGNITNKTGVTLTLECEVINDGLVYNYVEVTNYENETYPYDNWDHVTFIALPIVDISITKEGNFNSSVNVTDIITFTITVHNSGPSNATSVMVYEILNSTYLKFISYNATKGVYNGVSWFIGDLNNGSTEVLNVTAEVIAPGSFSNFVNVTSYETDTDMSNNYANITNITSYYWVDLDITKTASVWGGTSYVLVGGNVQFIINVVNNGPCEARNVTVREDLADGLKLYSKYTATGDYDETTGIWNIGTLAKDQFAQLIIVATVMKAGNVSNFVSVNSTDNDTNMSNNNYTTDNITALPTVNLIIDKKVNQTLVVIGDKVEFNITVTNKGLCNATQVNVTEIINNHDFKLISNYTNTNYYNYTGGYWYIGNLNVNETVNLTIVCEVLRDGIIPNRVEVTSYENDTYPYDNWDIVYVSTEPIVDIIITKESNATNGTVHIYDIIEFNITVHNAGPSDATSVIVAEPLNTQYFRIISNRTTTAAEYDGYSWNIGNLANNATETLTIVCQVVALGDLNNYANVTVYQNDTNSSNNEVNITIKSLPIVDLNITKVVDFGNGTVNVSSLVQFTITVRNKGPCDATNVTVIEKLSPLLKVENDPIIHGGSYNVTTGIWYIGDLAYGDYAQLTIQARVVSNGTISNFVSVTSNETDTNSSNNNDTIENITALPVVDLNITKQVNVSFVNVTGTVKFTINVTNHGPSNATRVNVTEILDKNIFRLISNETDTGYYNLTGGYWYIGNLGVNKTANLTIVCQVIKEGIIKNHINASSYENDTDPYNNWDEVEFIVLPIVDISIIKEVNVKTVNVTDEIIFTITVHNGGPSNATSVMIYEKLNSTYFELITYNSTKGEYNGVSWFIGDLNNGSTEVLNITVKVVAAGTFSNFVNASSYENDTDMSNNNYTLYNITALPIVDLNITKVVDKGNGTVNVGDYVQFTIRVVNKGPCDATNVTVTEKLSSLLNMTTCTVYGGSYNVTTGIWYIGDLPANASASLTIGATVKSNGTISNFVVVKSNENDTNTSNNNYTIDNITALPVVDLNITKTVNASYINATDKVLFTIIVHNKGPSNATKVNVTEIFDENIFKLISNHTDTGYYNITGKYWYIGNLNANETVNLTLVCQVLVDGTYKNYVNVTSHENETAPGDNWAEVWLTAYKLVDIVITKEVNVTKVNVTDLVKFTINVTNIGPSNATGVFVGENIDLHYLKVVSSNATVGRLDETTWVIGDLAVGSTETLTIICEVISVGNITNFVYVNQTEPDKNESSNNATVNFTSVALVNMTITKKANVTHVNVGEMVKFTINVTNYGPSNATAIEIMDVLDNRFEFISTNVTWEHYYRVNQTVVWRISELANGTSYAVELVVRVLGNGTIENVIGVKSHENPDSVQNKTEINSTYLANLTVIKKANVTTVNVGELVRFTINVTNYGPSNATDVNVSDVLDSRFEFVSANGTYTRSGQKIIWNIPKLVNGTSSIIEFVVRVLGNGTIENVVSVNSTENKTGTENKTSVNATYLANLTVTKKANVTHINVGELVKFTINVTNYGPSNATDVNITDVLDSRFEFVSTNSTSYTQSGQTIVWNIPKLTNNTYNIIEFVVRVLGNGTIENVVTVNSTENKTGTENTTDINATYLANLTITKKANVTHVNVGELVRFTINVTNYGPSNATDVNVTDILDARFEFVSTNESSYTRFGQKIIWNIPKLTNGTSRIIEFTVRVLGNGTIENIVSVNSTENKTGTENKTSVNATYLANLTITKKANVTEVNVGELVRFTINVTNYGPSNATDVNVTDILDARFEFVSTNESSYTRSNQKIIWNIPKLTNGTSRIIEFTVRVLGNGTIENIVSVNSTENKTGTENKTSVNATYLANLTVTKKANVSEVNVGEYVKFTINITNYGPSNATNVNVTDVLDSRFEFISTNATADSYTKAGQTIVWNVPKLQNNTSHIIEFVVRVLGNGTIANVVSVNSTENTTGTTNDTAVNATNLVNLTVVKTSDVNVTVVGGLINFTITVTNNGPTNATNVKITDELIDEFGFVDAGGSYQKATSSKIIWTIPELASGNSTSVWIQVRALTNGTFTNVAVANSTENDTNVPSNESNVTVKPYVNWTVVKTSNVTNASIGDLVKFTITVTNTGLSNATNVIITDVLDSAFEFKSTDCVCTRNGQKIIWTIPRLNINTPYVIELTVKTVLSGFYSNVAVVNSTESENKTSNETPITVLPAVNLTAVKKANVTNATIGDLVNFTIIITNHGPSTATNVNLTDILPDGMIYQDCGSNATGIKGSNKNNRVIWNIQTLKNGESIEAWVVVKVTKLGTLTNVIIANSTENTTGTTNETNVTVDTIRTPINLDCYDIYYGDDEIITVTLPKEASGTVNITVGGITYDNIPINNGIAEITIVDLGGGNYTVDVIYGGDGTYLPNSTSGTFRVLPLTPTIKIEVVDIWHGEVEVLNVTVNAPGTVNITVYGKTITIPLDHQVRYTDVLMASNKLDYDGKATWVLINLPVGTYPAFAIYNGNENYTSVNTSDVFHVRDKPSTVVVTAEDIYVGEDAVINVQVGPRGVTGNVTLIVEGKEYNLKFDANGKASLTVPGLKAGLKHVYVRYNGDILYRPSENTTTFNVLKLKPPIDVDAPDIEVGEDGKITVKVPKNATGKITIKVNGKTYTAKVKNGKAVFIVPGLKVGTHKIEAYYTGDDMYLSANTTGKIKVTPKEIEKDNGGHYGNGISKGLSKHKTGNPIFLLLIVVLAIGSAQIRRFKK